MWYEKWDKLFSQRDRFLRARCHSICLTWVRLEWPREKIFSWLTRATYLFVITDFTHGNCRTGSRVLYVTEIITPSWPPPNIRGRMFFSIPPLLSREGLGVSWFKKSFPSIWREGVWTKWRRMGCCYYWDGFAGFQGDSFFWSHAFFGVSVSDFFVLCNFFPLLKSPKNAQKILYIS